MHTKENSLFFAEGRPHHSSIVMPMSNQGSSTCVLKSEQSDHFSSSKRSRDRGIMGNFWSVIDHLANLRHMIIIIVHSMQIRRTNPEQTAQIHIREPKGPWPGKFWWGRKSGGKEIDHGSCHWMLRAPAQIFCLSPLLSFYLHLCLYLLFRNGP